MPELHSTVDNSSSSTTNRDATVKRSRSSQDTNVDVLNEGREPKKMRTPANELNETSVYSANSLGGLPVEILAFEICTDLEPKDLWHLSCTSIHFRHILKSSDVAPTLWKASRELIGMPDCPPDLTDIQYTNLAFGKKCQYCGRFVMIRGQLSTDAQSSLAVQGPLSYYLLETGKKWKRECSLSVNPASWMTDKIKELNNIETHAAIYKTWDENEREDNLFLRRQSRLVAHLKSLGWEPELSLMSEDGYEDLFDIPQIYDACCNELTDTVLISMGPDLNVLMSESRVLRLQADRRVFLENRLPILSKVAKECAAQYSLYTPTPSAADLFKVQLVRDLIDDTSLEPFTSAHLDPLRVNYAQISHEWRTQMEGKLISLIKSACGTTYNFDESSVLRLATTIFSCKTCRSDHLRYPNVLAHYHGIPYEPYISAEKALDELERRSLSHHTRSTIWNDENGIYFNKDRMRAMADILEQFGFDPAVTTSEEMDAADPIFECVSCNSLIKGRCVLRWNILDEHRIAHDRQLLPGLGSVCNYELLTGEDEIVARRCIDSDNGRIKEECGATLNEHVWKEHGIAEPGDSDILISPTAMTNNQSRMWPPRKINYLVSRK
ncbi:hypothetical protein JR316_0010452 [Psilocybe cubensis]|uniref:Uncharacterized protein n=1 Tax=Psilocybe cubensis TaxID=181762 RepID=A0ACB8GNE5_PSICU|nr:hypothetical protein JR316_0010452 [Psilocybe cubensis]KAH9476540.1 hypothetical protein JR316_0010452 [Psilocybe cubensis]